MRKPIIEVIPLKEYPQQTLENEWRELFDRSAGCFFLSWNWIGSWLSILPDFEDKYVVRASIPISQQDIDSSSPNYEIVGFGIFCEKNVRRHGFVKSKQWHLHRTGDEKLDQIWIEYNDFLLAESGSSQEVNTDQLRQDIWLKLLFEEPLCKLVDEFSVNVASPKTTQKLMHLSMFTNLSSSSTKLITSYEAGFLVDFSTLPLKSEYPKQISKSTYRQIKRTKEILNPSNIQFEVILNPNDIKKVLEGHQKWHINKWAGSNTPSGFENSKFQQFHNAINSHKLSSPEAEAKPILFVLSIQLKVIGLIYGFVDKTRVYFYLSSLQPQADKKIKLGLLMHQHIVRWAIEQNYQAYDFLAGNAGYKKKLSNLQQQFECLLIQRPSLVFKLECALRNLKRILFNKSSTK